MAFPSEKNRKFNYQDYLQWTDDERWELIDGEAYNMTPAPSRSHQEILGALFNAFYNYLVERPCKVFVAPLDVRLPEYDQSEMDVTTVVQPDLTVICDPAKWNDVMPQNAASPKWT